MASIDLEAQEELERLRAHFGIIQSAPPRTIDDRYEIDRVIDRGGMGVVYLAKDAKLDRKIALKLIVSRPFSSPELLRQRLLQEAKALASVDHTHVVTVYDVGTHRGELYLSMQYIDGTTLRTWQSAERRPLRDIVGMYLQAARGLSAAHGAGVVHRDFKPENVLVDSRGAAYVGDFGVAAMVAEVGPAAGLGAMAASSSHTNGGLANAGMTRTGQFLGTLPYMAPEQLRGERVDARTDQYGFCASLWEACSGQLPFAGDGPGPLLAAMASEPQGRAKLPAWLARILARGLARDPRDRYADIDELIRALESGLGRRRRALTTGGAALAASLVVLPWLPIFHSSAPTCESFTETVDSHWNADRRAAVMARESATPMQLEYIVATIDSLVTEWKRDAEALCVDGGAPPADDGPRGCMEAWLVGLEHRLDLFIENDDPMGIQRAPEVLMSLKPHDGDYCGNAVSREIDSEVWASSELARGYTASGDYERAGELVAVARARAAALDSHERPFSANRAIAIFADADRLGRARDPSANSAFVAAQAQALASNHDLLEIDILLLWTKYTALRLDPDTVAVDVVDATSYLALLESFLWRAKIPPGGLRRIEALEAAGLVERARGVAEGDRLAHERAIAMHRQAVDGFVSLGRPELATKSLNNIGANYQNLGEPERAREAYAEALAIIEVSGLPPSYPIALDARLNLANITIELGVPTRLDEDALQLLTHVLKHGPRSQRLKALLSLCEMTSNAEAFERGEPFARQVLAELEDSREISDYLRLRLTLTAGLVLMGTDGDAARMIMREALPKMREIDAADWLSFVRAFTTHLEVQGQCEEAARWTAVVRESEGRDTLPVREWLEQRPGAACEL